MATPRPVTFGILLKRARRGARLTQEELARRAGYSAAYISSLERNARLPLPATIDALAEALALDLPARAAFLATIQRPLAQRTPPSSPPPPRPLSSPRALSQRLVGRHHEMIHLDRHLAGEGPPLLLLAGEPGIGKSRLLEESAGRATQQGWTVLAGGCHQRSGQEPFAPFVGAIAHGLSTRSLVQQRVDLEGCAWLVRLLPELLETAVVPAPSWTLSPDQERRLMFAAVGRFLANITGPAGTLLILDDLQWAGRDALDLVAALAHMCGELPVRILGAFRRTEAPPRHPLAVLLADLHRADVAAALPLGALSEEEAAKLLAALLEGSAMVEDQPLMAAVLRRAQGAPYFLVSYARGLRVGDPPAETMTSERARGFGVPTDVAEMHRQRIFALPKTAQALLQIGAVIGREAPARLLLDVAVALGLHEQRVLAGLDQACHAALLVENSDGATYRFAHDLVHDVVDAGLGAARRAALHHHVAEALELRGGTPPEALAHHYLRAGLPDRALIYLERAGERALAMHAYAEAEEHYRRLIEQLERLGKEQEAAGARVTLGTILFARAHYRQALHALEPAVETFRRASDWDGLASAAACLAHTYASRGAQAPESMQQGLERVLPLLDLLRGRQPSRSLVQLCLGAIALLKGCGRFSECVAYAERAAEVARALQDDTLLSLALAQQAGDLYHFGSLEEAERVSAEATALGDAAGYLEGMVFGPHPASMVCQAIGDLERDRAWVTRSYAAAEVWGTPMWLAHTLSRRGKHFWLAGDWSRAQADFERALTIDREIGGSWNTPHALLDLGILWLATERRVDGIQQLEEAVSLARQWHDLQALRLAQPALAEYELLAGHPQAAQGRLLPLLDRPEQPETPVTRFLALLAWAYLALDEITQAETTVAECLTRARARKMRPTIVDALRVRALLATRRARWQEAEMALEEALPLSRAVRYPYLEAKVLCASGQCYVEQGASGSARERYEQALAILHRLGERLYGEQVEHALADLG